MVAALRSWRLRIRLYLVWLLTRHPRFKPLYISDVVSHDPVIQAEHLANAGYLPAAASMVRSVMESRVRRVCLLSPNWRSVRGGRGQFSVRIEFLRQQGLVSPEKSKRADRFYGLASELVHGQNVTYKRCRETLKLATELNRVLNALTRELLKSDAEAKGWESITPPAETQFADGLLAETRAGDADGALPAETAPANATNEGRA